MSAKARIDKSMEIASFYYFLGLMQSFDRISAAIQTAKNSGVLRQWNDICSAMSRVLWLKRPLFIFNKNIPYGVSSAPEYGSKQSLRG